MQCIMMFKSFVRMIVVDLDRLATVMGRTGGLIYCFVLCRAFPARRVARTLEAMRHLSYTIVNTSNGALYVCFDAAGKSNEIAGNGCDENEIRLDKLSHAFRAVRF
jgi:hypothetical protein